MRPWLLLLAITVGGAVRAQDYVTAQVVDATTGAALEFATVGVTGSRSGTITNSEGWFGLRLPPYADSLRITYVGYVPMSVPINGELHNSTIRLQRASVQLREVEIRPGEDLYARVMASSTWLARAPTVQAKLFFDLKTHSGGQPVELLQACFNATYGAAMLRALQLKQGRIGLAPKDGRHFMNYNTAGAFLLMDPHGSSARFPRSPLSSPNARKLREHFAVQMIASGAGPHGTDHLRVTPREQGRGAFTMDLWLDAGSSVVHKVELSCTNCQPQPFRPLFPGARLDSVDLRYSQTWSDQGPAYPQLITLDYGMRYSNSVFSERFATQATMYAFERDAAYITPLFPWREGLEEYRAIAWLPFDTVFWEREPLPLPTEHQQQDEAFIARNDISRDAWFDSLGQDQYDLRPRYIVWNAGRRLGPGDLSGVPHVPRAGQYRDPPVRFVTHLYLDLDTTGGRLRHRSYAVFDAGASWHTTMWETWSAILLNLTFDLCEIERRAMEERLSAPGVDLEMARRIYAEHERRLLREQQTLKGAYSFNTKSMMPWNRQVRDALGINNMRLLGGDEQEDE